MITDAAKEHDIGKDIGGQLDTIATELTHLLDKAESRLEVLDREGLDGRTRFVSELAASFLRSMMESRGGSVAGSEVKQAVDMASEIVKQVKMQF